MFRTGLWFLAAGVLVTIRATIELADPVYWDPVALIDYAAAVTTTLAWLVTGVALFSWWLASPIRRGAVLLLTGGLGTAVSGFGNLIEDVFAVEFGEFLFNYGGMVGAISLLLGSVLVLTAKNRWRWAGLYLLAFVGGSVFPDDGGQFLSGASLLGLGFWALRSARTGVTSPAHLRS